MPNLSRNHRQQAPDEKGRTGKLLSEKSASFHGRNHTTQKVLGRPKTDSDLLSSKKFTARLPETPPKLTKLLLNVTIERSLGAVHVVMSSESTVGDLVASAVRQYVKEGRRPLLTVTDPSKFDLHYSSFSLESLDRCEKLMNLGSRNFFMCPAKTVTAADALNTTKTMVSSSTALCWKEADKVSKSLPWSKILELFS